MSSATSSRLPSTVEWSGHELEPARGVFRLKTYIVNLYLVGYDREWVLVDAGMPGASAMIFDAAKDLFGDHPPKAIVMTHGHFDHVGSLRTVAERWNVPIYAHPLELPYMDGRSAYPPPDPTVGGGFMARSCKLYPRGPFDFSRWLRPLPPDGTVPHMHGWRWLHTPGHSPGHVAFFRDQDRALIAGDAFVTTKQESLNAVLTQRKEIHGPPMYYTCDWAAARASVRLLNSLNPSVAATGHGVPLAGQELREGLAWLADNFDEVARPRKGRYVPEPAITDENGVVTVPPPVFDPVPVIAASAALAIGTALVMNHRRRDRDA